MEQSEEKLSPCVIDFFSVLPDIFRDIDDADFVAFDGEFTGILPLRQMGYFDTPAHRYHLHHEVEFFNKFCRIFSIIFSAIDSI